MNEAAQGMQDPDDVRAFFAEHASSWQARYSKRDYDSYNFQERARIALDWLAEVKPGVCGKRALDLGCGAGVQAAALAAAGWSVIAADLSIDVVREGAAASRGPAWTVLDCQALPFKAGAFDAILMLGVVGYLAQPEAVLRRLRNVMRPGAHLVISWYSAPPYLLDRLSAAISAIPTRVYRALKACGRAKDYSGRTTREDGGFYAHNLRSWRPREFLCMLRSSGFTVIRRASVYYGELRFMGKRPWPESMDMQASRVIEAAARVPGLHWLSNFCKTNLVLASPGSPG